ncbi:major capsid protein [Novosphingobium sp.]|uniref:major capsid protein n=1 Tax=Novosphingobium sp. TaxID=1874826 RepID=UPI00286E67CE|nr:major capsid protein [Novosphingobium sp.]
MLTMDIFKGGAAGGAFSAITLTTGIKDVKFTPGLLGSMNLVSKVPIRTEKFAIERMTDSQRLIPVTERGTPMTRATRDRRNIRDFRTLRTAKIDHMRATEVAEIRAFGSETELMAAQTEVAMRLAKLRRDHELTEEYRLLGMIAGNVLDSDGSGVLYNWFTEFGIAPPTELGFNWAARTQVNSYIKQNVIRPIVTALQGRAPAGMRIVALCDGAFYDALIENAEVRATYLNWQAAEQLRGGAGKIGAAYESFDFGGVTWIDYRNAVDANSINVGLASGKCRIFPVGVPDMFQKIVSPDDEDFTFINTLGQEYYARSILDPSGYNAYVEMSVRAYNAHVCTTPEALLSGRVGA